MKKQRQIEKFYKGNFYEHTEAESFRIIGICSDNTDEKLKPLLISEFPTLLKDIDAINIDSEIYKIDEFIFDLKKIQYLHELQNLYFNFYNKKLDISLFSHLPDIDSRSLTEILRKETLNFPENENIKLKEIKIIYENCPIIGYMSLNYYYIQEPCIPLGIIEQIGNYKIYRCDILKITNKYMIVLIID